MPDEEQSPAQKAQSACGLCCAGWLIFPLTLLLLGYSEKSFVCTEKNILYAEKDAQTVACDSKPEDNQFIHLNCALDKSKFKEITLDSFGVDPAKNSFGNKIKFSSLSARMEAPEMYQCIETPEEVKKDPKCQDTEKVKCETKTIYHYEQGWRKGTKEFKGTDTPEFKMWAKVRDHECAEIRGKTGNPDYPELLSNPSRHVVDPAAEVKLQGNYYLTKEVYTSKSPNTFKPNAAVDLTEFTSAFTKFQQENVKAGEKAVFDADSVVVHGKYLQTCAGPVIGCVRVSFMKNDDTGASIIANSGIDGRTTRQNYGASWGCSAGSYVAFYESEMLSKDAVIERENQSNKMSLYSMRVFCILLAWAAMYCCMYPLVAFAEVMDEYVTRIPCIGPILGVISGIVEWLVSIVVCCMSCSIACAGFTFTITVVWLVMKPPWQSFLMLLFCAGLVAGAYALAHLAPKKEGQARDLSVELNNQA